jgi:hypothetical protein
MPAKPPMTSRELAVRIRLWHNDQLTTDDDVAALIDLWKDVQRTEARRDALSNLMDVAEFLNDPYKLYGALKNNLATAKSALASARGELERHVS